MSKSFASQLKHLITIEKPVFEDDGAGGQIQSWQEHLKVWAEVQALYEQRGGQGEIFTAMQLLDNGFYRFRIRFLPSLRSNMRIIYDNRIFKIKRIVNQGELNYISIIMTQESL